MPKEKTKDFTKKDLPKNRFKQFFDISIHRFLDIFKLSLLQAIFAMPLLATCVLFYVFIRSAGDKNSVFTIFLVQGLSLLITIPLVYLGLTGTFYCLRKIIHAESEYTSSSFFIGLKQEWGHGLLLGIIEGISAGATLISLFLLFTYLPELNASVSGIGIAMIIIQFILVTMFTYHCLAQLSVYKNPFRYVLKNSFLLMTMRFPFNLLFLLLHPGIFIALMCIMEITMYVGVMLSLLFSTFGYLIWMLNIIAAFDKYINKEHHPEIYKKGLYIEEQKED